MQFIRYLMLRSLQLSILTTAAGGLVLITGS